jgi:hypothetical protein
MGRTFSDFFLVTADSRSFEIRGLGALLVALVAIAAVAHHNDLAGFGASWVAWTVTVAALWLWGQDRHSVAGIAERAAEAAARAARRLPLVVAIDQARVAVEQKNQKICSIINNIEFYPPFALSVAAAVAPRILPIPRGRRA